MLIWTNINSGVKTYSEFLHFMKDRLIKFNGKDLESSIYITVISNKNGMTLDYEQVLVEYSSGILSVTATVTKDSPKSKKANINNIKDSIELFEYINSKFGINKLISNRNQFSVDVWSTTSGVKYLKIVEDSYNNYHKEKNKLIKQLTDLNIKVKNTETELSGLIKKYPSVRENCLAY